MSAPSVTVITGTSSGFGYDTARLLAAAGHRVYGTMRDIGGKSAEAARTLGALGVTAVEMEITDQASVDRGAAKILDAAGHVDVLINNAGASYMGPLEAFTPEALQRQLSLNIVGPFRVSRAFLPGMRAQRSGLVVFLSSGAGRLVVPFMAPYAASKWGLEALAEAFSYELHPFGVEVAIVEPGAFSTNIGNSRTGPDDATVLTSYGDVAKGAAQVGAGLAASARPAIEVAEAIAALVALPPGTRPLRTVVPAGAPTAAVNAATAPIQRAFLEAFGLNAYLPPERTTV